MPFGFIQCGAVKCSSIRLSRLYLLPLWLVAGAATAADSPMAKEEKGLDFFESKIRPVLAHNCYKCHSASGGKSESSLLVDTREKIRAGGDRGPAIVPGDPKASLLLTAISHTDPDLKMPPKKDRLPDTVIADFRAWIEMGAPDPRSGNTAISVAPPTDLQAARRFWSLQKPVAHVPPATKNPSWARRELDHFVLAKLEAEGLAPSADAEPAMLLRRLYFDLIGLPPSPDELREILARVNKSGL